MTRKRCKRKVYAVGSVVDVAIRRASIIGDDMLGQLRQREGEVFEAFRDGTGTPHDWRTVADILNVAETMADSGIGIEVKAVCVRMQNYLAEHQPLFEAAPRIAFSPDALQCFSDLREYHDLQRTAVPMGEYLRMVDKTSNRIRSAHPSVKVFV